MKLKGRGGRRESRGIVEFVDGLRLSFGDFQNQRIVELIDQVYGFVEVLVAGRKSSQALEFEESAGLDAFDGFAGGLKCFATEAVYGRLNAASNAAEAHSDPERQRPQRHSEVLNDGGNGRQVAGDGLKFIAGGNKIRQLGEPLSPMAAPKNGKAFFQQAAGRPPTPGF